MAYYCSAAYTHKLATWGAAISARLPLAHRFREAAFVRDYEIAWGRHQAAEIIQSLIMDIEAAGSHDQTLVLDLSAQYRMWQGSARRRLDGWAREHPAFVEAMQELLAERLILTVEFEALKRDIESGSIPHGVRDEMLAELRRRIRGLKIPALSSERR